MINRIPHPTSRITIFILGILFLVISCRSEERVPNDVLPKEKMEKVLWDMIRADQFVSDYVLPKDSNRDNRTERIRLYQEIFRIHDITREEFNRSFEYYRTHPAQLKPVIDSIYRKYDKAPTDILKVPLNDSLLPPRVD